MALITVARKSQIANGKMLGVEAGGRKLLVANYSGTIYAMDAVCSHMSGDLTKGRFESGIVICPRHGAQYDVKTGKVVKNVGFAGKALTAGRGAIGQQTFRVVVDGDDVKVEI